MHQSSGCFSSDEISTPASQPSVLQLSGSKLRVSIFSAALTLVVCVVLSGRVSAQQFAPDLGTGEAARDQTADPLQRLPTERRLIAQLEQLSEAAERNERRAVLDLLQTLQASDPGLMVPGPPRFMAVSLIRGSGLPWLHVVHEPPSTYVPLHRDLVRRIQAFPGPMQAQLLTDDESADSALTKALATRSASDLVTFLHRYAGSKAALQAHFLLALMHADRGHTEAAKYWLAPLLGDDVEPVVRGAALKLRARLLSRTDASNRGTSDETPLSPEDRANPANPEAARPGTSSTIVADAGDQDAGEPDAGEPDAGEPDAGTDNTGEPDRPNAEKIRESADRHATDGESGDGRSRVVQHIHWMQSLPLSSVSRRRSQEFVRGAAELGVLPWTAWAPELDSERIYIRTPNLVTARDLRTGRHLWTRAFTLQTSSAEAADEDMPMFQFRFDENSIDEAMNSEELKQVHRNEIVGRMSSDESRLYAICQTGEATSLLTSRDGNLRLRAVLGQSQAMNAGLWELVAIEKATGRRLWTTGGQPVEEKFGNELAMSWFAGPPAVRGSRLYQVLERNGSVQLACLNAETGQLEWILPLVYPDLEISQDPARQLIAAQILAEAGVVYTTTTTGWMIAVDTLTQAVMWARPLPQLTGNVPRSRVLRNIAFLQMQQQPIGRLWRSRAPFRASDSLITASAESAQMIVLDPVTGEAQTDFDSLLAVSSSARSRMSESTWRPSAGQSDNEQRTSADNPTAIVHVDSEWLVTASPQFLTAIHLPERKRRWQLRRAVKSPVPAGSGVRIGERLIVPLSDGTLEVIDLQGGAIVDTIRGLRPAYSTGGLYATEDGVITCGPNHLSLLSESPPDSPDDADPLQQALFLLETGRFQEARESLTRVHRNPLNAEQIRRIRFRIALTAFASETPHSAKTLEEVAALAQTAEEKALSQYLRLDSLVTTSPEAAGPAFITALQDSSAVLAVEIPQVDSEEKRQVLLRSENPLEISPLISDPQQLRHPLRSWIVMQLRRLLDAADETRRAALIAELAALSDHEILEIRSAHLAEEYLRRADVLLSSDQLNETLLHLLMETAASLQPQKDLTAEAGKSPPTEEPSRDASADDPMPKPLLRGRLMVALDRVVELSKSISAADPIHRSMVQRLTDVVRCELLNDKDSPNLNGPNLNDADPLKIRQDSTGNCFQEDPLKILAASWEASGNQPYTMLPVSTFGQVSHRLTAPVAVTPAGTSDPFMSGFQWTIQRSPSALMARSVTDAGLPQWALRISGAENNILQSDEELFRFGSVLILQNMSGLSAFSVTDQRWLWTRQMQGGVSRRMTSSMNRPFEDFSSISSSSLLNSFGRRIVGGSRRWICVYSHGTLQVLDLLTGSTVWSMTGMSHSSSSIAACNSAIVVHDVPRGKLIIRPADGSSRMQEFPGGLRGINDRTICGSGEHLVVWSPKTRENPRRSLMWVDPVTDQPYRVVPLPDSQYSQFLDLETLVSVTNNQTFQVVNLRTAHQQTFSFATPEDRNSPVLSPEKIVVAQDAANYYVFERQQNAMIMMGSMYNLRAEPIQGELRAVSRQSGQLAWTRPVPEGSVMACLEGIEPVMLIITISANPRANAGAIPGLQMQPGQRYLIDGVSRLTGVNRLSYPVVAQYPLPNLRMTASLQGYLDLEAFGNRVRFLPGGP